MDARHVVDGAGAILVVDDSPLNLRAVAAALADMCDEIVTAQSGNEALRQLLRRDFAVVLLDVAMPELDGYETARLIRSRERHRHAPIIFLTAFDRDRRDVLRAYELGAVDFLFKPVQPEVLRSKVSVFVELQRRSAQVALQAERVRELERQRHQHELETQRRELEAAAVSRQMEEQWRTAQRLAEMDRRKDHFLAMLGHELRTPLAAMTVGLELASAAAVAPEAREGARLAMKRQLQHLVRLVDDLLDVTRIGTGRIVLQRQRCEVDELVDRAVELARPAIDGGGHQLHIGRAGRPVPLMADPARIVQVIANLLHNAARYTGHSGQLQVAVSTTDDRVRISVEDDGRGIAPDKLESVFGIFEREADDTDGLGLGLTLARTLVELHGGEITAHSDGLGCGARFEVALPIGVVAGASAAAADSGGDDDAGATPAPGCRVLIVDDSDDLRETLRSLLSSWGHHVVDAATGELGVRALLRWEPDIALIDIGLPDLDGCELVRRVREAGHGATRLIALTGFTQPDDRERIERAGFDVLVAKPPDLAELRRLLGDCARSRT